MLPSSESPESADALDAAAVTTLLEQLRQYHAFTVIDCEHALSDRTLAALDAADRVILVTQLNVPALRSTQRTLALCQRLGYARRQGAGGREPASVARTPSASPMARKFLGREIFFKIPNDYRTSAGALTKGVPVAEFDASVASGVELRWIGGSHEWRPAGQGRETRTRVTTRQALWPWEEMMALSLRDRLIGRNGARACTRRQTDTVNGAAPSRRRRRDGPSSGMYSRGPLRTSRRSPLSNSSSSSCIGD